MTKETFGILGLAWVYYGSLLLGLENRQVLRLVYLVQYILQFRIESFQTGLGLVISVSTESLNAAHDLLVPYLSILTDQIFEFSI